MHPVCAVPMLWWRPTNGDIAARPGAACETAHGDSVGTYICTDLSCHDNVRLAAPLAPSEMRGSVDLKIDGTRRRTEAFVARVLENGEAPA